ncbi:MAG: hypothetical protein JXA06_05590 [Bacteroidetes bacterium]|nr:hypothetical protein [Bacteroidota bacterium]
MNPADVLIPITLFGGCAVVLYKYFDGRNKERMAMIEKGVSPADFKSISPFRFWQGNTFSNLKWGLLFVFTGLGLLTGLQIESIFGFNEGSVVFATILISGGLALIIFYLIAAKKLKKEQ